MDISGLNLDNRTQTLIKNLRSISTAVFGSHLIGVYIHGSMALGAYNPRISDLDYLIVVSSVPSNVAKLKLMHETFRKLIPYEPHKGLEFHVVTQSELKHGRHPFRFELHYSPMHKQEYCDDPSDYVARMNGLDPDLAVHLAVTWQSGIVVEGEPIQEVFLPVSTADYLDSAWGDVVQAGTEVISNPVYTILNLCRLYAFLKDGYIRSKADGGRWGLNHLNNEFYPVIEWALSSYTIANHSDDAPQQGQLIRFANEMLYRIRLVCKLNSKI
jgi:streptomycin 3"-adenylyltransferase